MPSDYNRHRDDQRKLPIINNLIFKSVGQLHADLSPEERRLMVKQLKAALEKYEQEVLNIYDVRCYLYNLYNSKLEEKKSVAALSQEFNMSIRGHNDLLAPKVVTAMQEAFKAEVSLKAHEAIKALQEIKLRHLILFSEELLGICERDKLNNENAAGALVQLKWIEKFRETLFKSVIKMAVALAVKHKKPLSGEVISEEDMIQEAVMAAKLHVNLYQPIDDGATFTTFMYSAIDYHLSHYVNENTRTVALPRTIIDRYRPLKAAADEIGYSNLEALADAATLNLYNLKQQSSGRKLEREEAYTAEEAHELISCTQDTIRLQEEIKGGYPQSLVLTHALKTAVSIEDPSPSQEEQLDKANVMTQLMSIVQECSNTPEEYTIMEIRWGMGEVRGLNKTAEIYKNTTGRPMNKGKVAHIERRVLARMREKIEEGDSRLPELKEVVATFFG